VLVKTETTRPKRFSVSEASIHRANTRKTKVDDFGGDRELSFVVLPSIVLEDEHEGRVEGDVVGEVGSDRGVYFGLGEDK